MTHLPSPPGRITKEIIQVDKITVNTNTSGFITATSDAINGEVTAIKFAVGTFTSGAIATVSTTFPFTEAIANYNMFLGCSLSRKTPTSSTSFSRDVSVRAETPLDGLKRSLFHMLAYDCGFAAL